MTHQNLDYINSIHQKGYRFTPQRQSILDAVCEGGEHTTFKEICTQVWKKSTAISLPTIYRNLIFLCETGLVASLQINNKTYYEIADGLPHHHLICRKCGKIYQFSDEEIKDFFKDIMMKYGFMVDMDHIGLGGLCADCRSESNVRTN